MGTLYIVGTPIGNLEDISPRALRVLGEVRLIAAENPARTRRLLARYDIQTPMKRFTDAYDRKKQQRLAAVLAALAEGDVALVSEAGMPGLADPGYELIAAALEQGLPVVPVPGPTALAAALAVAGLPAGRFTFLGFLPRAAAARRELLASLVASPFALVAYEAPHRLLDTLAELAELFGERPMAACCELTKLYEETRRGTPAALLAHFQEHPPRGEFTLVIAGTGANSPPLLLDLPAPAGPQSGSKAWTRTSDRTVHAEPKSDH
jgi:16S rRNA (cytidine1402-2'-O)-methyltransferase